MDYKDLITNYYILLLNKNYSEKNIVAISHLEMTSKNYWAIYKF